MRGRASDPELTKRRRPVSNTGLVFGCALLLFAATATGFEARVTDLSALRVLDGDLPYRDFWTMYAPGSFVTVALAFWIFGRELLVSNILGIVTSATAVMLYYRLASPVCGALPAKVLTGLVALAFFGTGYHDGFTSYPPAFALILAAAHMTAIGCRAPGWRWGVAPGLLFGGAGLFKHDIAGYAVIAAVVGVVVTRYRAQRTPVWMPALALGAAAATVVSAVAGVLVARGAGPDMWRDLVQFPLTEFPEVRPENFPLVPPFGPTLIDTAQGLVNWSTFNLPLLALIVGMPGLRRQWRAPDPQTRFVVAFAFQMFWLHWAAAHVQLNTNAISLTAWGAVVAGVGLHVSGGAPVRRRTIAALFACVLWAAAFVARPAYDRWQESEAYEWVGIPGLAGIRVPHSEALWMRALAAAAAQGEDPRAPLLFLSNRNDVNVYAESTPYWLTARRPATRHHELHPGITDTEYFQRQMIADLERGRPPLVVREHRFPDRVLDTIKADFARHVAVGATLIDRWVAERYETGERFGRYELMKRKSDSLPSSDTPTAPQ